MIAHLTGPVLAIRGRSLVVEAAGVGYLVAVGLRAIEKAQVGQAIQLWIHTHQTNDTISLFGFVKTSELDFFELLCSVNGVGPRTALEVLETPIVDLRAAISAGDVRAVAQVKGIGPKTAARIVLELKPKLTGAEPEVPVDSSVSGEAIEALTQLGYRRSEIQKTLTQLPQSITQTEEIVKWFLKKA